ncbi:putative membrane protein [Melghirimyces profundicolus]|uniref:Putative membrane protein n=1 Tax=Melghirimyces profundicolus TaxID=1242148 RepID=A0A2T6BU96_9BACL|nr:phage holin family protein [Melghirimyces profundicolus]PTX59651.1 putative membrane protein [Melghirimyces profundicolus]
MGIIVRLLLNALAVLIASQVIPQIDVEGFGTALMVALILGLINTFVRPVLVFLTLPISLLTLGLFIFVLNALLFWLTGALVSGFEVEGFLGALLGSILVSVISWLLNGIWKGLRT